MAIAWLQKFGNDLFDLEEVVALVGRTVYLRDGRKTVVGVETADALRAARPEFRGLHQDTPGTGRISVPCRTPRQQRRRDPARE